MKQFSDIEKQLLNDYQHDLPLTPHPFAEIAVQLGTDEATVLDHLQHLQDEEVISRVGPVFRPNRVGVSTLAAMSVPEAELETVANIISSYIEVNHNYEREHHFNLWFVANAMTTADLQQAIEQMEEQTGYSVMQLPMQQGFHINLGFNLHWT